MAGAIARAEQLKKELGNAVIAGQFISPANPLAHYRTTGKEIYEDTDGQVDALVAGVGTGGTISGAGRFLKEKNPAVKVIAAEPAKSAVLSGKPAGAHGLQGIGAGFVPEVLDTAIYDEVVTVTEEDAFSYARMLAQCDGLLTGISSGAALCAAVTVASRPQFEGKTVVVILPDLGDRYLSTGLYN